MITYITVDLDFTYRVKFSLIISFVFSINIIDAIDLNFDSLNVRITNEFQVFSVGSERDRHFRM